MWSDEGGERGLWKETIELDLFLHVWFGLNHGGG